MKNVPIKNKKVKKYKDYVDAKYYDTSLSKEERQEAGKIGRLIYYLVLIYEQEVSMEFEEDFSWLEMGFTPLPEDIEEMLKERE